MMAKLKYRIEMVTKADELFEGDEIMGEVDSMME